MQDGDKTKPKPADKAAEATPADASVPPTQWDFKPEEGNEPAKPRPTTEGPAEVSWTASEFIAHDKAPSWYTGLAVSGVLLAILIYLLTRDWLSTVVIIIITAVFGVFAARKPRVLNYALDQRGLHIASKFYPYGDFKSFAVMDEGAINGLWLMPLKRFMPSITIYYAPSDEENILNVISRYLPLEQRDHDMVDRLMRKVKF